MCLLSLKKQSTQESNDSQSMTKKIDELNDIVVERDKNMVDQTVLINLET